MTPFNPGDYVRFLARLVGPRPSGRPVKDWMEPTRPTSSWRPMVRPAPLGQILWVLAGIGLATALWATLT
ncbi:MAG: hypothetical protein IM667_01075 [Phenylobacterium sp.]|uniref:hypothetical protein n=1 Tax=Phenylobacterium sp. TaxID=1871053 RepID=UPI0025CE1AF3|nr:hypothetical protein [Phenylobacterium sp.]MCA3711351.1 hypothetical protein [Phenylobacterium sp.]MCA6239204.1 hypothetical protein [Phenylobacterium sp.]